MISAFGGRSSRLQPPKRALNHAANTLWRFGLVLGFFTNSGFIDTNYPLGIFFLVIRWLGTNYSAYNALTLILYFSQYPLTFSL